jgi:pimeloyl-ACP methyl ester carboxylesterase
MNRTEIKPENVHLIGHSLGAHIAGNAGRFLNGQLSRVTGLDPAGPHFPVVAPDALKPDDARFVDVVHSDDIFGSLIPRGMADFYPNRGTRGQPGCVSLDLLQSASCNHMRAVLYYAESILAPWSFPAFKCELREFLNGANGRSCMRNTQEIRLMGDRVSSNASGTYFLETNAAFPFGRGQDTRFEGQ